MIDKKLAIVVLNYNAWEETVECVNSIATQKNVQIDIVIVDNGSINNSYEKLSSYFSKKKSIYILKSDTNLGFARGNNLGIKFARENLKIEFVFVLNSDTLFNNNLDCYRLMLNYKKGTGIIQPVCLGVDGEIQIPYGRFNNLYFAVAKDLLFTFWQYIKIIFNINYSLSNNSVKSDNINLFEKYRYIIQGPAFILTPDFFGFYQQLYPKTFLYGEELMLAWYLKKAELNSIIVKDVDIIHKEGKSTIKRPNVKSRLIKNTRGFISWTKVFPLMFYSRDRIRKKYS